MVNLGTLFLCQLSHDSARRVSRLNVVKGEGQDMKGREIAIYKVELRYILPNGYESSVASLPLESMTEAQSLMASTIDILKREAGFC